MLPTRFSARNCTLLDNLLCKLSGNTDNYSTGILTNCISDHQPFFIILDLIHIHKYVPKFIKSNSYDLNSIINFKRDVVSSNIIQKLNSDRIANPNDNYNTLDNVIQRYKDAHLPTNIKNITNRHKKSNRITSAIVRSISIRDQMYKRRKQMPI